MSEADICTKIVIEVLRALKIDWRTENDRT